ncbi:MULTISPECIES: cytochrome P450 [Streptomycetaceae]|uniref:Cytochrome P450 hydroxylase n=1 Tax=Streptantibioticus cattleyicolor (strain ATCC 35852 / DSM 46488 / JCM 4925 / NBRC 14057 / NRRL 8057) TaxID=1003195 RepID=F8JYW5_STREN|nr:MULTISPECIES: cytochrome P450 [Streptomycetaceae]AEW93437.1 cytochrome P450 hydroxylase [Streptantibioticus cattleyicolor NRRL 8057 = DSM 46488]MYS58149.1 cytochrome P450 [Streptomyces sp. SID5468]CCB73791.1 putative cytochrome P450 139 [Streptantibioticus cattleyicolor NRRL 8057 = DSM 46488]
MHDVVNCPSAPGGLPLIGHTLAVLGRPLSFFESTRTDDPLVRVVIGRLQVYLANDPDLVHRIQVDTDTFERGRFFEVLAGHFDNPPIASNGPAHRGQRRALKPVFNRPSVRQYTDAIVEEAEALAAGWRPGRLPDVRQQLSDVVACTVLRCLFSTELSTEDVHDIQRTIYQVARRLLPGTLLPAAVTQVPTPGNRRLAEAMGRFRVLVERLVREREEHGQGHHDALSALLHARHGATGRPLTPREIRGEFLVLLFAALETTSTTLAWALYEIATHPRVAARLADEVDAVLRDGPATYDGLQRMPYLRQVLHETLRLHPPTLFTRRTRHAVTLAGVAVPAGAEVGYSPRAMHRHPGLHRDPARFDPSRIGSEGALPQGAFFPFGVGAHRCIGEHLAMTTMAAVVAAVVARWTIRLPPRVRVRETISSMPHPDSLPLQLTTRPSASRRSARYATARYSHPA